MLQKPSWQELLNRKLNPGEMLIFQTGDKSMVKMSVFLQLVEIKEATTIGVGEYETTIPPGWQYIVRLKMKDTFFCQHSQYVTNENHLAQSQEVKELVSISINSCIRSLQKWLENGFTELKTLNDNFKAGK